MSELRKYGVSTTFAFPLIDRDEADWEATPVTFAAGDVKISKDGGGFANTTNLPSHVGLGVYELVLTATEMTAARIVVTIIDQTAPKVWEDQGVHCTTYGNASAQHAFDLDSATVTAGTVSDKTGYALTVAEKDDIVDRNWDELRSAHVAVGSFGQGIASVQGNVTGSVASVTGAVGSVTGNVGGTINGFTAAAQAEIESEVNDALVAVNLDHFIELASTVVDATPAAGQFGTGLAAGVDNDHYKGQRVKFVNGLLANQVRRCTSSAAGELNFSEPFTQAPANGDGFVVIADSPVGIDASAFWDELEGAEPTSPIASNATMRKIMQHIKRRFMNKVTQDSALQTIFRDDSTTVLEVMVVSDDGTTQTKGKAG